MLGVQDIYALRHKVFVEGKSQRQVALPRDAAAGATGASIQLMICSK